MTWDSSRKIVVIKLLRTSALNTSEIHSHERNSVTISLQVVVTYSNCCRIGNALCLCLPIRPAKAVPEHGTRSTAIEFAVKTFNSHLEYDWQGLNLDLNLKSAA